MPAGPSRVDGCAPAGCTPFLSMAALQVRRVYSKDIYLFPIYFPTCFVIVYWSETKKKQILKNAKNTHGPLYNRICNWYISLWYVLFVVLFLSLSSVGL